MGLPTTSKPVCTILFKCPKQLCAANIYYFSEQIAEICNQAGDLVNVVSKELVDWALSNESMTEYYLPFSDLIIGGNTCATDFFYIYVSICFCMNGDRFTAAERFMLNALISNPDTRYKSKHPTTYY
jgi:hypothetical protein